MHPVPMGDRKICFRRGFRSSRQLAERLFPSGIVPEVVAEADSREEGHQKPDRNVQLCQSHIISF